MLPITGPVSQIGFYDTDSVNSSLPEQNARHFEKDIFKCIFLNENIWISIKISLKFVPKGSINHISALVQIMDWHRLGDKPLSEPMLNQFTDAYMRHYVEMSLKKYVHGPWEYSYSLCYFMWICLITIFDFKCLVIPSNLISTYEKVLCGILSTSFLRQQWYDWV